MKSLNIDNIFKVIILLALLKGANAWFFWGEQLYINLGFSLFCLLYALYHKQNLHYNGFLKISIAIFSYITYYISDGSLNGFIGSISQIIPIYVLIGCDKNVIQNVMHFCQKILMYIFIPSIILHLFLQIIPLPPLFTSINVASDLYAFDNYLFLIRNPLLYERRFCSIFLEPGYLGTLCCFMLLADRFDFKKKENKIILIALLLSLSLAGYVITLLGYLVINIKLNQKSIKLLIYSILSISLLYTISVNYNNGKNYLNNLIFERLQYDEDKGIKGNNRVFGMTDEYFTYIISSDYLWKGLGLAKINEINEHSKMTNNSFAIAGAGYKIYILKYGLLAVIYIFFAYLFLCLSCNNRRYSLSLFLLTIITFIQAAYPLSLSWLIPIAFGLKINSIKYNASKNILFIK